MKTLILSACSILALSAAPQSTPPVTVTVAVPRAREDAPRSLKIIDLRELLKSDVETLNFTTSVMIGIGRSATPTVPKPQAAEAVSARPRSDDPEVIAHRASAWQDMLTHWIRPALRAGNDTLQITRDGTLIANLTEDAQAWLDQFIALQRETKRMVSLQVDFITGRTGAFDRYASGGSPSVITADDAKQLLADSQPGGALKRFSQRPLVGWVRVWNNASMLDWSNYVKDWTIETVEPGHKEIAVPQIATVENGQSVDVRAVPLDATHVGLELDATQSTVTQPIATKKVKLDIDGGREVEIALPEVTKVTFKSQISLEYGSYALFVGMKDSEGTVAVLVHVERRNDTSPPVMQETISASPRKKGAVPDKH